MPALDPNPPCVSFIGIVDFSDQARWLFCTESVTDLLGYEPSELIGRPSLELVHPDETATIRQLHYDTIRQDKAACLAYLRMKHKDPYKGYILCGVSRTIVQNVVVGSVSFASPGPKAMHNASTAQEVTIISPTAANFEFRRWGDPSPMPPSPLPSSLRADLSPDSESSKSSTPDSRVSPPVKTPLASYDPLPYQSVRTALILDRFTVNCTVMYCSNDKLVETTTVINRSFFDFVSKKDEELVRSWIDVIKGWGVNERGQPSDGGFGFGKFIFLPQGRDSAVRVPEPPPSRHRHGSHAVSRTASRSHPSHAANPSTQPNRPRLRTHESSSQSPAAPTSTDDQLGVDAIFSAHSDGLMVILRPAPL